MDEVTGDEVVLTPEDSEFTQTGLKVASKIRVTKIVTLDRQQQLQQLNEALRLAFQLHE